MEGPPLGPGGGDITWPDQVAPRGQKASSTRRIKPQTSNLTTVSPTRESVPVWTHACMASLVLAGLRVVCLWSCSGRFSRFFGARLL